MSEKEDWYELDFTDKSNPKQIKSALKLQELVKEKIPYYRKEDEFSGSCDDVIADALQSLWDESQK